MNILLLQTGIFLEELPLKPELGDFISTKCSATDLFDRRVSFEKEAETSEMENVFCVGKKWKLKQRPTCTNICSSITQRIL